ncbi:hypothetical protein CVIRNUC_009176 [Coccomyxa viridis]|uniref:Uncharacterized protein n=1 Tax=Coccomyxa viridis TaxID=1274662 RepID=A0AAV1IF66_9CHLO|nr:hypothetical protein CVIRNUC_009176 [Coccomyxa viridis]
MGNRKRKSAQQPPMGTLDSCVSISGGDDAVYEELPSLFGSSPKRVALESHSSDLSTQSELLCGEWLGYMSLDSSFDVALHSSPSRTSNSSSASADSVLSVGTTDSGKGQGHHAGLGLHCRSTDSGPVTCCCELTAEPPGPACFGWGLWNVPEDCVVRSMAAMYGFSDQCTAVGTSYFVRLAARDERLMRLAKACPDFAPLVAGICVAPDPLERPLAEELRQLTHPKQWLMALHLTCTYLAAKNVDKVLYRSLLTLILSHAHGDALPARVGANLEAEILKGLRWRLGPFLHSVPCCNGAAGCGCS